MDYRAHLFLEIEATLQKQRSTICRRRNFGNMEDGCTIQFSVAPLHTITSKSDLEQFAEKVQKELPSSGRTFDNMAVETFEGYKYEVRMPRIQFEQDIHKADVIVFPAEELFQSRTSYCNGEKTICNNWIVDHFYGGNMALYQRVFILRA